jgi:hypothetical protein
MAAIKNKEGISTNPLPIVLGRSIKIGIAVACFLMRLIFHFDIHNAFQTCPDDSPDQERTWLQINQIWLEYYHELYPEKFQEIKILLKQGHHPEQFSIKMFMFVQGWTDTSCKWGELVKEFIFSDLELIANLSNPCTYSGMYKNKPVILCQATDDFLLFCPDKTTYDSMIVAFRIKWTVHALNKVKMFFGIRFICSDCCVTLNQTHKIKAIMSNIFGPSYNKQSLSGRGYSTPMLSGTKHANELAACTPFTPGKLKAVQTGKTYGFVFDMFLGDSCIVRFGLALIF